MILYSADGMIDRGDMRKPNGDRIRLAWHHGTSYTELADALDAANAKLKVVEQREQKILTDAAAYVRGYKRPYRDNAVNETLECAAAAVELFRDGLMQPAALKDAP